MKHPNRPNAYKHKKSACAFCKPHKRAWVRYFKETQRSRIEARSLNESA